MFNGASWCVESNYFWSLFRKRAKWCLPLSSFPRSTFPRSTVVIGPVCRSGSVRVVLFYLTLFLTGFKRLRIMRGRELQTPILTRLPDVAKKKTEKAFDSSSKVLSKLSGSYFSKVKVEVTKCHQRPFFFSKINIFRQIIVNISKTMIEQIFKKHQIAQEEPR